MPIVPVDSCGVLKEARVQLLRICNTECVHGPHSLDIEMLGLLVVNSLVIP